MQKPQKLWIIAFYGWFQRGYKFSSKSMHKLQEMIYQMIKGRVPYKFVCKGVPVCEGYYSGPSACIEGWPIPFLKAFSSSVSSSGAQNYLKVVFLIVQLCTDILNSITAKFSSELV